MISPMFIRSQRKLTSVVSTVSKVLRGGGAENGAETVSYTHLTLPTIYSV